MQKMILISLLVAFSLQGAELKFCLDGDSRTAPGVKKFSNSIRQVPGHFGKALLFERRTVNSFIPSEVILKGGATLKGKNNHLVMPAGSCATLPLTAVRPKSSNTLSFRYKGAGKIAISFNREEVASFEADAEYKTAVVVIVPEDDSGTLRIRTEKAVELDQVMLDKGIGYANTYHAPGKMRDVDQVTVAPAVFSPDSGAVSCWIKAPWLRSDAQKATSIALCAAQMPSGKGIKPLYICFWSNGVHLFVPGSGTKSLVCSCLLKELPESTDGWYHFVFNWKRENENMKLSIIVNGDKVFTTSGVSKDRPQYENFNIGFVNGAYLNGMLDDFGLFSEPLSLNDAKQIYKSKLPLQRLFPR